MSRNIAQELSFNHGV